MTDQEKLLALQEFWARSYGKKVDVYRVEGKGILAVEHGRPLQPATVIFQMSDREFNHL